MKKLALFFGIILGLGSLYFGSMALARRAGQEAGREATKTAIAEFKRAMEPTAEQKRSQKEELAALEIQLAQLRKEAESGVGTGVK